MINKKGIDELCLGRDIVAFLDMKIGYARFCEDVNSAAILSYYYA